MRIIGRKRTKTEQKEKLGEVGGCDEVEVGLRVKAGREAMVQNRKQ